MSITDAPDDIKNESTVCGTTSNKDHQPTSNADTEEVKKASTKSTYGEEKEEAAKITNTVTNEEESEEEEEAQVFFFDGKYYDTFQEMVNAKRDRNRRVLERSGAPDAAQEFRATASAARAGKMKVSTQKKDNKPSKNVKPPPPPRNKYNRESANNIDYSAERVLGHVIEKEEDKPEEERTQTRSSDRLRKQKEASQAEDKESNRREMESYVPPKEDKKRDGQPKTEGEEPRVKKAKANDGAVLAVMQRPAERNKTMLSLTGALTVQKAIAAFGPWKEMMQKKCPDVLPHNYVSLYYATLDLPPSAGCEGHVKKLLRGNRTLEIAPSTRGHTVAYPPHVTAALLEYIVKDAMEEGLTVEKLYKGRGKAGSIISNKAKAFLEKHGFTFTSKKEKKQLTNYLCKNAKPKIEEALKEEAGKEEALKEKAGKGMDI